MTIPTAFRYVSREIESAMRRRIVEGHRIIILYGARRVGKTTLVRHLVSGEGSRFAEFSGDDSTVSDTLSSRDSRRILGMVSGYDLVFIDEIQRIAEIGVGIKIIHDNLPVVKVIVTGSSSFDLASQTGEALTGRSWSFSLSPFSVEELSAGRNQFELDRELERNLVYGFYPEVQAYDADIDRAAFLRELYASYLFKDILQMGGDPPTAQDLRPSAASRLADRIGGLVLRIGNEARHEQRHGVGVHRPA